MTKVRKADADSVELVSSDGSTIFLRSCEDILKIEAIREWNISVDFLYLVVSSNTSSATIPESDPGFDALLQWLELHCDGVVERWNEFFGGISVWSGNTKLLFERKE